MSKRELLKYAVAAWRKQGSPKPRGWRKISFSTAKPKLEGFFEIANDAMASAKVGKPIAVEAIAVRLRGL